MTTQGPGQDARIAGQLGCLEEEEEEEEETLVASGAMIGVATPGTIVFVSWLSKVRGPSKNENTSSESD